MPSKSLRTLTLLRDLAKIYFSIRFWNLHAKIQNAKVFQNTGTLVAMRSIDPSLNPRVPINQHIPNFPGHPSDVAQMNGTLPFLYLNIFLSLLINKRSTQGVNVVIFLHPLTRLFLRVLMLEQEISTQRYGRQSDSQLSKGFT